MPVIPHIRMSMIGRLGGTSDERFSYSVNLGRTDGTPFLGSGVEGQTFFDDCAAGAAAFHSRPATGISTAAVLEDVKFAFIGADGKYTRDPYVKAIANVTGGSGGDLHPPQVALAVSLTTARRGPTGKGRFFLPMPTAIVGRDDLLITVLKREEITVSCQTFLNGLANQPGVDVVDVGVTVISSKGYASIVTGVRVGRALDTIRSRRTSLPEDKTLPLPVA